MFVVEKSSSIPSHGQLRDQIKFAIAVGRLRLGDTLPSVRDLESELGLDKNRIWRVYKELAKAGHISLRQGKGAQINSIFPRQTGEKKLKACDRLCQQTLRQVLREGIHPASFVSYMRQYLVRETTGALVFAECNRTETELFAEQVSDMWSVDVQGVMIEDLRAKLGGKTSHKIRKIITNSYHVDEVRGILRGTTVGVIGLNFRWHRRMLRAVEALEDPANLVFVLADRDKRGYGRLIEKELRSMVSGRRITVTISGIGEIGDFSQFCRSGNFDLIIVSNRLWDQIPRDIKKLPFVARPTLQIDPSSLEHARVEAGVIW